MSAPSTAAVPATRRGKETNEGSSGNTIPRKVAVVTGASQGIGAELVKAFRRIGYRVVANSRSIEDGQHDGDAEVLAVAGDIADPSVAARVVGAAVDRFGRLDTLVNNAGIFIPKRFTEYAQAEFAAMIAVNLAGFFHITQLAAKQMLEAGSGHIVTLTSALADQPMAAVPAALTSMTKGGLNAATRALAIEYAGHGIRVNAVSPGVISTPMHRPEAHAFLATMQPLGRMGTAREVADAVIYLEGASFVTGEIMHVDGGAHAGRW